MYLIGHNRSTIRPADIHRRISYPQVGLQRLCRSGRRTTVAEVTRAKDAVGAYGERVAAQVLVAAGMELLDRNWRCRHGELDIVARDGPTVVFCEVKTRRSNAFGSPAEAVGPAKVRRLRTLAAHWLTEHAPVRGEIRFDVVCVRPQPAGAALVEHLRGVC
jgi:putative endonuclease